MYLKEQLILILDHSHTELLKAAEQAGTDQEIYPSWKIKEVISHVTAWEEVLVSVMEAHAAGATRSPGDFPGEDVFNQGAVDAHQAFSLEQVIAAWGERRKDLFRIIQAMPDERFEAPVIDPWGQIGVVEDILRGFAAHERRHADDICSLIG